MGTKEVLTSLIKLHLCFLPVRSLLVNNAQTSFCLFDKTATMSDLCINSLKLKKNTFSDIFQIDSSTFHEDLLFISNLKKIYCFKCLKKKSYKLLKIFQGNFLNSTSFMSSISNYVFFACFTREIHSLKIVKNDITKFETLNFHDFPVISLKELKLDEFIILCSLDDHGILNLTDITSDTFTNQSLLCSYKPKILTFSDSRKIYTSAIQKNKILCTGYGIGLSMILLESSEKRHYESLCILQNQYNSQRLCFYCLLNDNSFLCIDGLNGKTKSKTSRSKIDINDFVLDKNGNKLYHVDSVGTLKVLELENFMLIKEGAIDHDSALVRVAVDFHHSLVYTMTKSGMISCFDDVFEDKMPLVRSMGHCFLVQVSKESDSDDYALEFIDLYNFLAVSNGKQNIIIYDAECFRFINIIRLRNQDGNVKSIKTTCLKNSVCLIITTSKKLFLYLIDFLGLNIEKVASLEVDSTLEISNQFLLSNRVLGFCLGSLDGHLYFYSFDVDKQKILDEKVAHRKKLVKNPRRKLHKNNVFEDLLVLKTKSQLMMEEIKQIPINWKIKATTGPITSVEIVESERMIIVSSISGSLNIFDFMGKKLSTLNMERILTNLEAFSKSQWAINLSEQAKNNAKEKTFKANEVALKLHLKEKVEQEFNDQSSHLTLKLDLNEKIIPSLMDLPPLEIKLPTLVTSRMMKKQQQDYKNFQQEKVPSTNGIKKFNSMKELDLSYLHPSSFLRDQLKMGKFNSLKEKNYSFRMTKQKLKMKHKIPLAKLLDHKAIERFNSREHSDFFDEIENSSSMNFGQN